MKNKTQRLVEIKKILLGEPVAGQEELLSRLKEKGFDYTQATLSRDLKFLKVIRVYDESLGYVYKLPKSERQVAIPSESDDFPITGFVSLKFSNNLGVIKTLPGYASGIALMIDTLNLFEILGTIAGDDTILIIPKEHIHKQDIINILAVSFPGIKSKI